MAPYDHVQVNLDQVRSAQRQVRWSNQLQNHIIVYMCVRMDGLFL